MNSTGIHNAAREYGKRYARGDTLALREFETEYGRCLKRIIARVSRSRRPRSRFEQVILMQLHRLSREVECRGDWMLVHRVCEAILVSSGRTQLIRA
jgi:hypothetical protein